MTSEEVNKSVFVKPSSVSNAVYLAQVDKAIQYLENEIKEIHLGSKDGMLEELVKDQPFLPKTSKEFHLVLSGWNQKPQIPNEIITLLQQITDQKNSSTSSVSSHSSRSNNINTNTIKTRKSPTASASASASASTVSTPTTRRQGSRRVTKKLEEEEAKTKAQEEEEEEEEGEEDEAGEEKEVEEEVGEAEKEEKEEKKEAQENEEVHDSKEETEEEQEEEESSATATPIVTPTVGTPTVGTPTASTTPGREDVVSTLDDDMLRKIKDMRKVMMLDVLSKISAMAKQKKIDQPSIRQSKRRLLLTKDYLDLDTIAAQVREGKLWNWNLLTRDVFLFCNNVIADGEKDREAKQNGIELLHFAKTLTEQVKKACYKKEESMKQQPSQPPTPSNTTTTSSFNAAPDAVPPVTRGPGRPRGSTNQSHLLHQAYPLKDLGSASSSGDPQVTTPQRVSARIRKRADSSVHEDSSPSPTKEAPPAATAATATTTTTGPGKKRQHNTSAVVDTSSVAESDQSDAGSKPNSTAATPTGAGGPVTRRTRKRHPVVVATRVSSRPKRARKASRDTDATGGEEQNEEDNDDVGGDDTETATSEPQAPLAPQDDTKAQQDNKPVLLRKDGRPRKKPGRKPGSGKKKQLQLLQQQEAGK